MPHKERGGQDQDDDDEDEQRAAHGVPMLHTFDTPRGVMHKVYVTGQMAPASSTVNVPLPAVNVIVWAAPLL